MIKNQNVKNYKTIKIFVKLSSIAFINILLVIILYSCAEILIRVIYPEINLPGTAKTLIESNRYSYTHGLKPNSEGTSYGIVKKVDDRGFWQYGVDKNDISKKLLLVGDSVTMGIGVESDSTFAGIIHNSINDYEILNPSLIAYTSQDYLNFIRTFFEDSEFNKSIDKLYIFWCLNDVYPRHILNDAPGMVGNDVLSSVIRFFRENSKLFHFLKSQFADRSKSYFLYDSQFYSSDNQDFILAMKNIREIHKICLENETELEVFLLPYEYQIREINGSKFGEQQLLFTELYDLNIKIHDCSKAFQQFNGDSHELYLLGDGIHFSTLGHKLLARYILQIIE